MEQAAPAWDAEMSASGEMENIDLDACAVPTPEQIEQMETGLGAIYTPRMALELGMQTAIGNVKRRIATLKEKQALSK